MCLCEVYIFFYSRYGDHRVLHVLTHSFPTRPSSDLLESAGDGLCLLQQLQGPIAPPSGANPDFAVFIIADQVLQHAPRLHVGGEGFDFLGLHLRSEEHTSELQSLMRISYAVFCLTKKKLITK